MSSFLSFYSHKYPGNDEAIEISIFREKLFEFKRKIDEEYRQISKNASKLPNHIQYLIDEDYKRITSWLKSLEEENKENLRRALNNENNNK